jgi:hypothetical protein
MKNSPHHNKHLKHKAVRSACHLELKSKNESHQAKLGPNFSLKPINSELCKRVLEFYKKHLEKVRLIKSSHDSKRTTPGEIEKGPYKMNQLNPKKITARFKMSDLEKSKKVGKKLLKNYSKDLKKAA